MDDVPGGASVENPDNILFAVGFSFLCISKSLTGDMYFTVDGTASVAGSADCSVKLDSGWHWPPFLTDGSDWDSRRMEYRVRPAGQKVFQIDAADWTDS